MIRIVMLNPNLSRVWKINQIEFWIYLQGLRDFSSRELSEVDQIVFTELERFLHVGQLRFRVPLREILAETHF